MNNGNLRALRQSSSGWAHISVFAILMSALVVILFLVLQRYLMDRLLLGGVEI
jgi:ABC-type glycerol-3-phosphate transport system permease component